MVSWYGIHNLTFPSVLLFSMYIIWILVFFEWWLCCMYWCGCWWFAMPSTSFSLFFMMGGFKLCVFPSSCAWKLLTGGGRVRIALFFYTCTHIIFPPVWVWVAVVLPSCMIMHTHYLPKKHQLPFPFAAPPWLQGPSWCDLPCYLVGWWLLRNNK